MERFDLIIIGSGIAGLTVARDALARKPTLKLCILEKSSGVGGRMATRRGDEVRFDHGAQFYRSTPEILDLHGFWTAAGVSKPWFSAGGVDHFRGSDGMTSLAKSAAAGIDIRLKTKVIEIHVDESEVKMKTDQGIQFVASKVVLTAPLPQALELLADCGIPFREKLKLATYAHALIGLATFERTPPFPNDWGYVESADGELFSVTDHQRKGISPIPALSFCFASMWSGRHFEKSDGEIGSEMSRVIHRRFGFYPNALQVKKWRFSHPLKVTDRLYEEITPGRLFLCGDGFGGPSLSGSVRSAKALGPMLTFS